MASFHRNDDTCFEATNIDPHAYCSCDKMIVTLAVRKHRYHQSIPLAVVI